MIYGFPGKYFAGTAKGGSWERFERECTCWPEAAIAVSMGGALRLPPLAA